jgi:hypothetical protein
LATRLFKQSKHKFTPWRANGTPLVERLAAFCCQQQLPEPARLLASGFLGTEDHAVLVKDRDHLTDSIELEDGGWLLHPCSNASR